MHETVFDRIRNSARQVSAVADHVSIYEEAIDRYANSLPIPEIADPELDAGSHYLGKGEDTLAFFMTLDSINFGSGYFPYIRKRAGKSGYFTIASCLCDYFQQKGPMDARTLSCLTPDAVAEIFGQDIQNPPVKELMELFAYALQDLGNWLLSCFEGSFAKSAEACMNRAENMISLISRMKFYEDVQDYKGFPVYFYKRAQLLCADLCLAFSNGKNGESWGFFHDLGELTIFADNLVPHVLRMDGILDYTPSLLQRINEGKHLPANSNEEIEIRACAVHAVERIREALFSKGILVSSMELDYLLWNRGQKPEYKACPRHRTKTVFY